MYNCPTMFRDILLMEIWEIDNQYRQIIEKLENYEKLKSYEIDFIDEIVSKGIFIPNVSSRDILLYYFILCVDWKWAYYSEQTTQSITIYDIFYNGSINKENNKEEFKKGMAAFKALFFGKLEFQSKRQDGNVIYTFESYEVKEEIKNKFKHYDINDIYRILISRNNSILKEGILMINQRLDDIESKNIFEFFKAIFSVFVKDNYAISDAEVQFYLGEKFGDDIYRRGKVVQFINSTIYALHYVKQFKQITKQNNGQKLNICNYIIGEYSVFHILIRHFHRFKIEYEYLNSDTAQEIKQKDGNKSKQKTYSEYRNSKGELVTSSDSSNKLYEEIRFLKDKDGIFSKKFETNCLDFYNLFSNVLQKNPSKEKSIVYYERELYELELNNNQINSFYPLNTQEQLKINRKEVYENKIINIQDIPEDFV